MFPFALIPKDLFCDSIGYTTRILSQKFLLSAAKRKIAYRFDFDASTL